MCPCRPSAAFGNSCFGPGGAARCSMDDTVFAWQLMAGLAYNFTPNMAATFSYAYFATSDPEFEGIEFDYASHNVIVGLRFGF